MDKGILILVCGLPGAGKTTLAKKLKTTKNANRLCPDDWILAILKDKEDIAERDRLRNPVEQLLWKEAQELLQLGVTVILENGFWTKVERDHYLNTAKQLSAKVELHFVDAPFDVLWERVQNRNRNSNEFAMTKKGMEESYKMFQPPTSEEGNVYDFFHHYQ